MTGKEIHLIDGVVSLEKDADFDERFEVVLTEEYDLNHHLHYRAKIKINDLGNEIEEKVLNATLNAIREFEEDEERRGDIAEFVNKMVEIACDIVDDPSFDLTVRYIGGDFPRYDISFVVW